MRLASAEELSRFKRRRREALLVEVVFLLSSPVSAVLVLVVLGEQTLGARVASVIAFVGIFVVGQLVRRARYRCPVCAAALPRGPRHVPFGSDAVIQCTQCGTRFEN
jgi:hypothetical protein